EGDVLVFVEVKCRRATWGDAPAAAVSWHKQRRLTQPAQLYLKWRGLDGVLGRFDVVSVTLDARGVFDVRHVRAAFDAVQPHLTTGTATPILVADDSRAGVRAGRRVHRARLQ